MDLEDQPGDKDTGSGIILPTEKLTYEEEFAQIRQELGEYFDKHGIPPLGYADVDLVHVQGHRRGDKYSVSSSMAKFASTVIWAGWLPAANLHPMVVRPTLNTIATMMDRIMNHPVEELSWSNFTCWLEACRSFSVMGFDMA
ncbi:PREDICTED: uncharacterized protein LOC109113926 [Nelumbo nucifera]|uniref:Uncharacterized protein LOC109113926 n=1 Tax=Nelumbo nucifera TaxID=4432 RepID=A0A1U8PXY4_NELNU|nr:PREDICTED: uncharacterized protein LOC109113926 [Nelumbo nucifera]